MDKLIIEGGNRLVGTVKVSGAKNSALPLMAATLLTGGEFTLTNVPGLKDIETFSTLLSHFGAKVSENIDNTVTIDTTNVNQTDAPYELVKTMRASVLALGPLLARFKKARVSMPGGCAIGARPIDIHLKGLEALGAKVEVEHGYVIVSAEELTGADIALDFPTVTGTANLMLAAVFAKGTTTITGAAKEPEIEDLERALTDMGAKVEGAGTDTIKITGVEADALRAIEYRVMPDRIEAGTFMVAAAMTTGNVLIEDCPKDNLQALIEKLKSSGAKITTEAGGLRVTGDKPIKSVDITTAPYPGFPTDMQAQMMAMMTISSGLSVISETIFENRFMHVAELRRMGAKIRTDKKNAVINGVRELSGAEIMATDLRASASLVLAGLVANGKTTISRIYHLDRGYEKIEDKLNKLGADIKRVHNDNK